MGTDLEIAYIQFLKNHGYTTQELNSPDFDTESELQSEVEELADILGYVNIDFLDKSKGISSSAARRVNLNAVNHAIFTNADGSYRDIMRFFLELMKVFTQFQHEVTSFDTKQKGKYADDMFLIAEKAAANTLEGIADQVAQIDSQYEQRVIILVVEGVMLAAAIAAFFIPFVGQAMSAGMHAALAGTKAASVAALLISTLLFLATLFNVFSPGGPLDKFLAKFIKDPKVRQAILAGLELALVLLSMVGPGGIAKAASKGAKAAAKGAKVAAKGVRSLANAARAAAKGGTGAAKIGSRAVAAGMRMVTRIGSAVVRSAGRAARAVRAAAARTITMIRNLIQSMRKAAGSIRSMKFSMSIKSMRSFVSRTLSEIGTAIKNMDVVAVSKMQLMTRAAQATQSLLSALSDMVIDSLDISEEDKAKLRMLTAIVVGLLVALLSAKAGAKFMAGMSGSGMIAIQTMQSLIGLATDIHGAVRGYQDGQRLTRAADRDFQTAILNIIKEGMGEELQGMEKLSKEFAQIMKKVQGALKKSLDTRNQAIGMAKQSAA